MPIEKKHQRVLELDKILNMLADCTSCDDGKEKALALEPQTSLYRAREMFFAKLRISLRTDSGSSTSTWSPWARTN